MSDDLTALAAALAEARRTSRTIAIDEGLVASLDDAYAVQRDSLAALGGAVGGWKVGAAPGGERAPAAALLERHVMASPAAAPVAAFVDAHIECEIAFLLGADLPARPEPYGVAEVAAAVAAVLPVIEIADSRLGWPGSPLAKIADAMSNGGLVTGARHADWRAFDLGRVAITLTRDGQPFASGSSAVIAGGPLTALVALANGQPLPFPLLAGQVVTTGSCTGMIPIGPGRYRGTFAGLGEVTFDLAG